MTLAALKDVTRPQTAVDNNPVPVIAVHNLSIDFWQANGWTNIINHISFEVHSGETFGLVGESGSGKTTTAYSLIGYRRPGSRVRAGQVLFQGHDLLQMNARQLQQLRGSRISLVPQNPTTALSPGMRIGAQIIETLETHGIGQDATARRARMHHLLKQVRLPEPTRTAEKYPHQLSGGQQQRVVLALALACNPLLMILDEPTTGLDVTTQAQILEMLVTLCAEMQIAMVYVTHNMGVVASICDRVGVMYAGELVEQAPTAELFRQPRHPYTRGLIDSVPRLDAPSRNRSVLLRGILDRSTLPPGCRFAPRCDFAQAACFEQPQSAEPVAAEHLIACRREAEIQQLLTAREAETSVSIKLPTNINAPIGYKVPEVLRVSELTCTYSEEHWRLFGTPPEPVVRNISFSIRSHETFALVGESGSGKSTIAKALDGLLKPLSGTIAFEGQVITAHSNRRDKRLRREIQLVLQNPDASLNPRQSVLQIVGRPLELFFGLSGLRLRNRVAELLEDVRLNRGYVDRFPDQLSGGERQRVAIARALSVEPKLVLCDEILSALDVSVQADVLDLLRDLQARHGIAYLFISHDLAVVRSLAHRVGVLYHGELVEYGQVEEVYAPPFHPYTWMLLSAVPEIGLKLRTESNNAPAGPRNTAATSQVSRRSACPFADRCPLKLGTICDDVPPPWQIHSATHALRCHIPIADLLGREQAASTPVDGVATNH